MKKSVLILFLFFGFFGNANNPEEEKLLDKAEKLMLINPKDSYQLAEKAYKNNKLGHQSRLRALFILTNTSSLLQDPTNAIKYGNEALANTKKDDVVIKIKILGILGNTYQSMRLNEKTRTYLDQAELLLSSPKIPDSINYIKGNIYYLKAMNYFNSLDSDIALSYFNKAINQYQSSKHPFAEINLKLAYLNKAFALIEQKHLNQALESFKLASINAKEAIRSYPPQFVELQETFIELGKAKIYSVERQPDLSNDILFKILKSRQNLPARDDIENEAYKILADNFLQKKDIKNHDHYEDLYMKYVAESNRAAATSVNKLVAQKEQQNITKKEDINRKYISFIIFSVVFLLSIIVFLVIKTYQAKQKRNLLKKEAFDNI